MRLVAYGYSALASGRQPKAISVISGIGLILPAPCPGALAAVETGHGGGQVVCVILRGRKVVCSRRNRRQVAMHGGDADAEGRPDGAGAHALTAQTAHDLAALG